MSLQSEQVDHIADLARIELTTEERERFREQLSKILEYFQMLNELDTDDVRPTLNDGQSKKMHRSDEIIPGLKLDEVLENAPDFDLDQFRVPPVFT